MTETVKFSEVYSPHEWGQKISYVKTEKSVKRCDVEQPYELWYVENFPLDRLHYTPLEDVEGETPRRLALADDIEKRGLINPLIVWNHTPSGQRPSPRPYYLHFGYNKLWALKKLGRTHARAFLTLDRGRAPEFPCMGCPSPRYMVDHFGDGTLVLGQNGPVFKDVTSLVRWELPAEAPPKRLIDSLRDFR